MSVGSNGQRAEPHEPAPEPWHPAITINITEAKLTPEGLEKIREHIEAELKRAPKTTLWGPFDAPVFEPLFASTRGSRWLRVWRAITRDSFILGWFAGTGGWWLGQLIVEVLS